MGEVRIQKDHLGRLDRRVRSRRHGDGTVCALHGQDVVDAVPRHGYGMAFLPQGFHDHLLLLGLYPAEDRIFSDCRLDILLCPEPCGVHVLVRILNAGLPGHLGHGQGIVSRNDLYINLLFSEKGS